MRLSTLIGARVQTESGEELGRCFDLEAVRRSDRLEVDAVLVGRGGFLDRLGFESDRAASRVEWSRVVSASRERIVVRAAEQRL